MPDRRAIPGYQDALGAFHIAFADELRAMVAHLPIAEGDRVLDLACGDGSYTAWLADRVGETGQVVAADLLPDYLELARKVVQDRAGDAVTRVDTIAADVRRLPLAEGTFDLAWCAQSLRSLPDPLGAIRGMARQVRPGGIVALLEEDALHHLLLPWPEDLELAVRRAELQSLAESLEHPRDYYAGRRLSQLLHAADLTEIRVTTAAIDRHAPLKDAERRYIDLELAELRHRVADRLDPDTLAVLDRLIDPGSPAYLPSQADFAMTCIEHVVVGRRPV